MQCEKLSDILTIIFKGEYKLLLNVYILKEVVTFSYTKKLECPRDSINYEPISFL